MKLLLLISLEAACSLTVARAEPRTSANYSITVETEDAGGGRLTSASYKVDASAGETGALATVASPAITAKSGYAGQLYDAIGFVVSATPTTVDEAQTRQLNGAHVLDDATLLAVNASSVSWSIVSGPITSISGSGLVTTGNVYQQTSASVQGAFQGFTAPLSLTVLNVTKDDFGIYAGDQIDDDWQVQYFGENNPAAAASADPDGDGQKNRFEFTAGVLPNDPSSIFRLRIEAVSGQPARKNVIFSPIIAGRTYRLLYKSSLTQPGPWLPLPDSLPTSDDGPERTITDTNAGAAARFYQVEITKP